MTSGVCLMRGHSHLQDGLELLQFGFLLLNLTVVVLAQFKQQQASYIQHFLEKGAVNVCVSLI